MIARETGDLAGIAREPLRTKGIEILMLKPWVVPGAGGVARITDAAKQDRKSLQRAAVEARAALESAAHAAVDAAALALSVAGELECALAVLDQATPGRRSQDVGSLRSVDDLSPRQREVLALVAEGRSNKAIAETLFVSPNTVKTHIASLQTKLHAGNRVQLATLAARQGLHWRASDR